MLKFLSVKNLLLFLIKSHFLFKLKMDCFCGKIFLVLMKIALLLIFHKSVMQRLDIIISPI